MKIGIAGCGGIGSNVAYHLIRSGVLEFRLGDFDVIEASNLNRQFYFHSQIGEKKALCLEKNLKQINPSAKIKAEVIRFQRENLLSFFEDCDIIVEAFDQKEAKVMLVEAFLETDKIIVASSGIADYDISSLEIRHLAKNLFVVGDFRKDIESFPSYSHKVNMVSAMMSKIILELGGYFEK